MKKSLIIALLAASAIVLAVSCRNGNSPKKSECTVTFDLNGGSSDGIESKVNVKYGDTVDEPSFVPKAAEDKYYVFKYWSKGNTDEEFNFSEKITDDITLRAVYKARYSIGGRGQANGFVVYENSSYDPKSTDADKNWKYLEVSDTDFSAVIGSTNTSTITWGNTNVAVDTETAVGTGASNTKKMKESTGLASSLAEAVWGKTWQGYSDWFIPSKDELSAVRTAVGSNTEANFAGDYYWSSSERGDNSAWDLLFGSTTAAAEHSSNRDTQEKVRLVRVF